jgi:hypothetical protein
LTALSGFTAPPIPTNRICNEHPELGVQPHSYGGLKELADGQHPGDKTSPVCPPTKRPLQAPDETTRNCDRFLRRFGSEGALDPIRNAQPRVEDIHQFRHAFIRHRWQNGFDSRPQKSLNDFKI